MLAIFQVVIDLVKCHEEKNIGKNGIARISVDVLKLPLSFCCAAKFFGACSDAKSALDQCFKAEKDVRRKLNMEKGKARQKSFEEFAAAFEAKKG